MKQLITKSFLFNLFMIVVVTGALYVGLFISLGLYTHHGSEVSIPNLVGKSIDEATAKLTSMDFNVYVDSVYEPREQSLKVMGQFPEEGAVVKPGRYIKLTVNRTTPLPMQMPDLKTLSYRSAAMLLRNSKLYVGDTTYIAGVSVGEIVEQKINGKVVHPGDIIPQGSKVDLVMSIGNHAPYIMGGEMQNMDVCQGQGSTSLSALLAVNDADKKQTETWTIVTPPSHGSINLSELAAKSNGKRVLPKGISYSPASGYSGMDSVRVSVSDGLATATTTIMLNVTPKPSVGAITGYASVSPGDTAVLRDSVAGGTWAVRNSNIHDVIGNGLIKGLSPGADTVTYTIANACGSSTASFVLNVRSYKSIRSKRMNTAVNTTAVASAAKSQNKPAQELKSAPMTSPVASAVKLPATRTETAPTASTTTKENASIEFATSNKSHKIEVYATAP